MRSPKPKPSVPCFWEEDTTVSRAKKDLSHYDVGTTVDR